MAEASWIERTASQRLDIESTLYRLSKRYELLVARAASSDGNGEGVNKIYQSIHEDLLDLRDRFGRLNRSSVSQLEDAPCATNSKYAS